MGNGKKRKRFIMVCATIGIFILTTAFIGMGFTSMAIAQAKQVWKPKGQINFIVASGVGTAYDILTRKVAQYSPEYFGVPMVVMNVGGGEGSLGMSKVVAAKPDGLTIGIGGASHYLSALLSIAEKRWTYRWKPQDLSQVVGIAVPPYVVVTGTKSPFKTWDDVRKYKAAIRFASTGSVTNIVDVIRDLNNHGVEVRVANFKGTPESRLAIESGDAQLWISALTTSVVEPIKEGTMRPLFIFSTKRYSALPDVPTHIELGMPEKYQYNRALRIVFTVPDTPRDILEGLRTGLLGVLKDPRVSQWGEKVDLPTDPVSIEEVKKHIDTQYILIQEGADLIKKYGG